MQAAIINTETKKVTAPRRKIAIVTCCLEDWGGSEDLWWKTAMHLNSHGCKIMVLKNKINKCHSKYAELLTKGVLLHELDVVSAKSHRKWLLNAWKKIKYSDYYHLQKNFERHLLSFKPDVVLISQGMNFDGMLYAYSCMKAGIPYSIVSHKAVEFYWPPHYDRAFISETFRNAHKCFFVSKHNLQLTEEQLGFRFKNASIVKNPIRKFGKAILYPSTGNGFKLACIGRLLIIDKGQDILIRILSQQKWKERSLEVSIIGTGVDEEGLKAMAALLNATNIKFKGHVDDMEAVWKEHHALVLPSRSEGLPLVVLEAMSAGRMVIATKAGGNEEVIEEDKTGFLGESNFLSFDAALEKAWQHRNAWEEMGKIAYQYALSNIPEKPETDFANTLTDLIYES